MEIKKSQSGIWIHLKNIINKNLIKKENIRWFLSLWLPQCRYYIVILPHPPNENSVISYFLFLYSGKKAQTQQQLLKPVPPCESSTRWRARIWPTSVNTWPSACRSLCRKFRSRQGTSWRSWLPRVAWFRFSASSRTTITLRHQIWLLHYIIIISLIILFLPRCA